MVLVAAIETGCGFVAPSVPAASSPAPPASPTVPTASEPPAIDPGVARLVWLVNRAGDLGVWTTDLAGGDALAYLAGLDEEGIAVRDARLVREEVALIRESAAAPTAELWLVSPTAPPRLLLDLVDTFVVSGEGEILAIRDRGRLRQIWRIPTGGSAPSVIAELPLPRLEPELGPFGFAISPDGRTVAAGWVGGPLVVSGPVPATSRDLGAPLVVADDGRVVAVTGRAGEAYMVDGDRLVELAPPDSDPVAVPGTGSVAWANVGEDGGLVAVEVRDLLTGTSETYPAEGLATNVRELSASHVILEATAFDPLTRTVGVVDLRDGRFGTFEALAPAVD